MRRPGERDARKIFKNIQGHLPFPVDEILECTEVSEYSFINFVFRVTVRSHRKKHLCYLKIAYPYLAASIRPPFHFEKKRYTATRMRGEIATLQLLKSLWGEVVPDIYYADGKNGIMAVSDVGRGSVLLIREFDRNRVHPEIGSTLGRLFGRLHGSTYGMKKEWCRPKQWTQEVTEHVEKYFSDPIRLVVGKKAVNDFIAQSHRAAAAIVWNDPIHRNMFIDKQSNIHCIDFDVARTYDPAYDVALLLSHWKWMELKGIPAVTRDATTFSKHFVAPYRQTLSQYHVSKKDQEGILERANRWMGIYLVYRAEHPVARFFDAVPGWKERVREEGIRLFLKERSAGR